MSEGDKTQRPGGIILDEMAYISHEDLPSYGPMGATSRGIMCTICGWRNYSTKLRKVNSGSKWVYICGPCDYDNAHE